MQMSQPLSKNYTTMLGSVALMWNINTCGVSRCCLSAAALLSLIGLSFTHRASAETAQFAVDMYNCVYRLCCVFVRVCARVCVCVCACVRVRAHISWSSVAMQAECVWWTPVSARISHPLIKISQFIAGSVWKENSVIIYSPLFRSKPQCCYLLLFWRI